MRLLHVHSGNLYGGIETLLVTLARFRHLGALEHEVALCFEGRLAVELRSESVAVHPLGEVRVSRPLTVKRARARLRELLRRAFDAVVVHSAWTQAVFGSTVKSSRAPLIFWLHGPTSGRHWLERWARTVEPDRVLCNSRYTAASVPALYPDTPYEVLYLPVPTETPRLDTESRRAIRMEFATPDDAVVIAQTGRLEPLKGHLVLLDALALIKDSPSWRCWLIGGAQRAGETRYLERLKAWAADRGIADRVSFCGERRDAARMLGAADIYGQPNTAAEGFGIALVEALCAGLPVVTTGLGGTAEVVDESCGISVPPDDPRAVAEALRILLDDPVRRTRMGEAGIQRAARLCDPDRQIARLSAIVAALSGDKTTTRAEVSAARVAR
jgi:glycosyltransferase involved in cell wall biosynthesis